MKVTFMSYQNHWIVYTDASVRSDKGVAGFGVLVVPPNESRDNWIELATNAFDEYLLDSSSAELAAVMYGLSQVPKGQKVAVYTDSHFVVTQLHVQKKRERFLNSSLPRRIALGQIMDKAVEMFKDYKEVVMFHDSDNKNSNLKLVHRLSRKASKIKTKILNFYSNGQIIEDKSVSLNGDLVYG